MNDPSHWRWWYERRLLCIDESLVRLSSSSSSPSSVLLRSNHGSFDFTQNQQRATAVVSTDPTDAMTTTTISDPTTLQQQSFYNEVTKFYAPITLENQFQDLYRLFRPALISLEANGATKNASAFLQGARGSGKSLLTTAVLQAIVDEIRQRSTSSLQQPSFRYVYINGLLIPGHSVHTVVHEILHQLLQQQLQYSNPTTTTAATGATNDDHPRELRKRKHQSSDHQSNEDEVSYRVQEASNEPKEKPDLSKLTPPPPPPSDELLEQLLKLSQTKSSFTNQLQLLNEIVEVASIDQIPILFVLDELDTFVVSRSHNDATATTGATTTTKRDKENTVTSTTTTTSHQNTNNNNFVFHQERQLLLYHLLERVTKAGSCCNFIGISSDSTLMMKLEKRIKSRAEGISKFIMTPGNAIFDQSIVPILCHGIAEEPMHATHVVQMDHHRMNHDDDATTTLRQEVSVLLLLGNVTTTTTSDNPQQQQQQQQQQQGVSRIYQILQRNYNLGKDVRWFTNVLYMALSLYRFDVIMWNEQQEEQNAMPTSLPTFSDLYIEEAICDMGGSLGDSNTVASTSRSAAILPKSSDKRIQTLHDLSGPLLVLVLSARRILYRDSCVQQKSTTGSHQNNETSTTTAMEYNPPQLTLRRMINEYQTSYKGLTSKYSLRVLQKSFIELLEIGIFRPSIDHSGTIPFQYQFRDTFLYHHHNFDVIERLPLHMTLDIHYDIKYAIDNNLLLNCSTALREWGRKIN